MCIIAEYRGYLFECIMTSKMSKMYNSNTRPTVRYIGEYCGNADKTVARLKKKYPSHSFQFYLHKKKPLSRDARESIQEFMRTNWEFREKTIDKILNS